MGAMMQDAFQTSRVSCTRWALTRARGTCQSTLQPAPLATPLLTLRRRSPLRAEDLRVASRNWVLELV